MEDINKKIEIEAIRAVAVLTVIFCHLKLFGFKSGYLGVDIFFVISGYLITGMLVNDKKISLLEFYARRIKRILPLACVVLVVTFVVAKTLLPISSLGSIFDDLGWSSIFVMNIALIKRSNDYFQVSANTSFFQHYWSLAVEEQFYLIYPILILLISKIKSKIVIPVFISTLTISSLSYWLFSSSSNPTSAYYNTFCRVWELGIGAIVLLIRKKIISKSKTRNRISCSLVVGYLILLVSLVRVLKENNNISTLVVVFLTALFLLITSLFESRPSNIVKLLAGVGGVSYGLYLWHWPVYLMLSKNKGADLTLSDKLIALTITILLTVISKILFEDKFHKIDLVKNMRKVYISGLVLVLIPVIISQIPFMSSNDGNGSTIINNNAILDKANEKIISSHPKDNPKGSNGVANNSNSTSISKGSTIPNSEILTPKENSQGKSPLKTDDLFPPLQSKSELTAALNNSSKPSYKVLTLKQNLTEIRQDIGYFSVAGCAGENTSCTTKPKNGKEIYLLGDSHANMWYPALSRVQEHGKYRVTSFAMPGCPPVDLTKTNIASNIGKDKVLVCSVLFDKYLKTIEKERPQILILTGATSSGDGSWVKQYPETIARLKPFVGKIIVLGDFEYGNDSAIDCYSKNYTHPAICGHKPAQKNVIYTERKKTEASIIKTTGVEYYDPTSLQCVKNFCPAIVNGIIVYRDPYHITRTYARWIGNVLIEELGLNK